MYDEEKSNKLIEALYRASEVFLSNRLLPDSIRKRSELFYLRLATAYGCRKCFKYHYGLSKKFGASKEEIADKIASADNGFSQKMLKKYSSQLGIQYRFKTHLYDWHQAKGRMTEFAGWEMPVHYKGILDEHLSVRNNAGIFDVSHMGRVFIDKAEDLIEKVSTNHLAEEGKMKYALCCNEDGGILDDIIYYNIGGGRHMVVVNASNREKMLSWFSKHHDKRLIHDRTFETSMIALQGPKSREILEGFLKDDLGRLERMEFLETEMLGTDSVVSYSGYTGESGYEIVLLKSKTKKAAEIWKALYESGAEPCGLGARDTLRLEAGNVLYSHDIDDSTTPLEARLDFATKFDKDFIGKDRLMRQKEEGLEKILVGMKLEKGVPRHGYSISKNGKDVGKITSGTFSPILKAGIALGYILPEFSSEGETLCVDIRGSLHEAAVVKTPFYDARKYGKYRVDAF